MHLASFVWKAGHIIDPWHVANLLKYLHALYMQEPKRGPNKFSLCLTSKGLRVKKGGLEEKNTVVRRGKSVGGWVSHDLSHYCVLPFPSFLFSLKLLEFKHKLNFFGPLLETHWFDPFSLDRSVAVRASRRVPERGLPGPGGAHPSVPQAPGGLLPGRPRVQVRPLVAGVRRPRPQEAHGRGSARLALRKQVWPLSGLKVSWQVLRENLNQVSSVS